MTPAEVIVAEAGGFLLASQALYYAREAIRQNWVKVGFSVAGPDARWPKPAEVTKPAAETSRPPATWNGWEKRQRGPDGRFAPDPVQIREAS
jgi:hypothetical protein